MLKILKNWLISALVILLVAYILPVLGVGVHVLNFIVALKVAFVLGLVNAIIKPIILLFTLPLTVLTLGFFVFVVNALMVMLTASLINGFYVSGFLSAFIFSLAVSFVNGLVKHGRRSRGSRSSMIYEESRIRN
ncbi:MAG: phage holin family protein [Candidatus Pacebacteria bacterium]|nr:phage holin family protein [Candidatus Paceibacterota bacterium]